MGGGAARTALGLTLGLLLWTATAAAEHPLEARYWKQPRAAVAEQVARHWLDSGNVARAMNWAERVARLPDVTSKQLAWVDKLRASLRWDLADSGYGAVAILVEPPSATVLVDGKPLSPAVRFHQVWLSEGSHVITVGAPDHGSVERVVTAARAERRTVQVQLPLTRPPVVALQVEPEAEVWANSIYLGRTSKGQFQLKPGNVLLEVRAEGREPWLRQLQLQYGDKLAYRLHLAELPREIAARPRASQVDRDLLPRELAERGGGRQVGHRPDVNSPFERTLGPRVERDADLAGTPGGERRAPSGLEGSTPRVDDEPTPTGTSVAGGGAVDAGVSASAASPSRPWSAATKGWIAAGLGLVTTGVGVGMALSAAREAEEVNQTRKLGDKHYDWYYDQAAGRAYIGYGVIGAGAVGVGLGAWYLFAKNGLDRKDKGWFLTGLGLAASGAAAWLLLDAAEQSRAANGLPLGHYDYHRRYDVAQQQALVSYGVGGSAAAVTGLGLYLALTSQESRSAQTDSHSPSWRLAPTWSPTLAGARLEWGF